MNGKSYEIIKENKTWIASAACAVARGGSLAEINNAAEQNAIFTQLNTNASINLKNTIAPEGGNGSYVWIGGNDLSKEGTWIWDGNNGNSGPQFWQGTASGSVVGGLYNNWGNEPDDYFGQDALALSLNGWPLGSAGQWNDVDHNNTLYYIVEYTTCNQTTSSSFSKTVCKSYTSPSGKIWTTSNTYKDTIPNTVGCDSIISINLTINTVDTSLVVSGNTITAKATGATYQWIDCNNGNTPLSGETKKNFTANSNGSYAVEITKNEIN